MVWEHISDLYHTDMKSDFRRTRLTFEHIKLTDQSRMRVYLAAQVIIASACLIIFYVIYMQVLSSTVANVMQQYGPAGSEETANFISLTDRFFDCLNGITLHDKKTDRRGYTSIDDPRFEVFIKP